MRGVNSLIDNNYFDIFDDVNDIISDENNDDDHDSDSDYREESNSDNDDEEEDTNRYHQTSNKTFHVSTDKNIINYESSIINCLSQSLHTSSSQPPNPLTTLYLATVALFDPLQHTDSFSNNHIGNHSSNHSHYQYSNDFNSHSPQLSDDAIVSDYNKDHQTFNNERYYIESLEHSIIHNLISQQYPSDYSHFHHHLSSQSHNTINTTRGFIEDLLSTTNNNNNIINTKTQSTNQLISKIKLSGAKKRKQSFPMKSLCKNDLENFVGAKLTFKYIIGAAGTDFIIEREFLNVGRQDRVKCHKSTLNSYEYNIPDTKTSFSKHQHQQKTHFTKTHLQQNYLQNFQQQHYLQQFQQKQQHNQLIETTKKSRGRGRKCKSGKTKKSYIGKECASCGTRRTPLWRDAEDGTPLCNACGIRYKKYKIRCTGCWSIPKKVLKPAGMCYRCGKWF